MISLQPKKGHLLIAEPSIIGDISFNRSVVLLADHNERGSVGFIMNKKLDFGLQDILPELPKKFPLYNGGPVEQDNLYFIHRIPLLIPDSVEIVNGIYWGGNFEVVQQLMLDDKISQDQIKFFLGYSGWDAHQLEEEMNANAWIVSENNDYKKLLKRNFSTFWKEKMQELGGEYLLWSNAPENPNHN